MFLGNQDSGRENPEREDLGREDPEREDPERDIMHELGVVFKVIDTCEEVAKENNVENISAVTLEIGEVSTVIEDYLRDVWKWAVDRTELMKGCELKVETIPAVTYCEDCKGEYSTVQFAKICPYCKSENTYLLRGNEFSIKEIEGA